MKIAVIGAGAIGSIVAGYLTKAGVEVVLVGHPEQVNAINVQGLKISGVRGDDVIKVKAMMTLDQEYDLVIFSTKIYDLEYAYQDNAEFLENGLILTLQAGVQADNILSSHFQYDRQLSSLVMFGATQIAYGEVALDFEGDWILGKPYLPVDPAVHAVAEVLGKAFKTEVSTTLAGMKWTKLFMDFHYSIPAVLGRSIQETFADLDLCRLSVEILREGVKVAKDAKIELVSLPHFSVDQIFELVSMPTEKSAVIVNKALVDGGDKPVYGSLSQSIRRGKMSEIEFINGELLHMAHQMRQEAPLNEKIVDMVHQVEASKKYFALEEFKRVFSL